MRIISVCLNPTIDITSETDSVYPVSKVRTHAERMSPGGGGVNVARVLSAFGVPCELVYLSGGATGTMLDSELVRDGINTRCFRNASPTRIAFTVLQTSNQQEYRFVPEGPVISGDAYSQLLSYLSSVPLSDEDIVVASGSLPRGVPDEAYASIAELVHARHARLILDSSGFGLSRALDARQAIFLIKPSFNELQKLAGSKLDELEAQQYAQQLVSEGRSHNVVVSLGSHGAVLINERQTTRLPAYLVKVQSAVGAGDSVVGAMVYYLACGHDVESAFRYGLAAGAAAVMTSGDQLCQPKEVERLYRSTLEGSAQQSSDNTRQVT